MISYAISSGVLSTEFECMSSEHAFDRRYLSATTGRTAVRFSSVVAGATGAACLCVCMCVNTGRGVCRRGVVSLTRCSYSNLLLLRSRILE